MGNQPLIQSGVATVNTNTTINLDVDFGDTGYSVVLTDNTNGNPAVIYNVVNKLAGSFSVSCRLSTNNGPANRQTNWVAIGNR